MSFEIAGDSNIMQQLGRLFADAKAWHEATAGISGTGSGQPTGLVTAFDGGASEVDPASGETFAAGDVYSTLESLPARHRLRASWTLGLPTINTISRFYSPSGSEPPLIEGDRLLRKRFYENSEMRDTSDINTGATADNHVLIVGDFAEYRIIDRVGSTVELIPNVMGSNQRPTGQRGAFFWWRVGANVTHIDAFRSLNIATTA
jgi:HK97 family phage major capsid protein